MARGDWALVCASAEHEEGGSVTARRVFQVLLVPFAPVPLTATFLFGLRGSPGEEVTLEFRFYGPKGLIEGPSPLPPATIVFTRQRFFHGTVQLKNFVVNDFGDYRFEIRREGSSLLTTARFTIAEDATLLPGSKPS